MKSYPYEKGGGGGKSLSHAKGGRGGGGGGQQVSDPRFAHVVAPLPVLN